MEYVTVYTEKGGITIGKLDSKGRLVYKAGTWVPISKDKPDLLDKELRKGVTKIVKDGGKKYKQILRGLALPPTYKPE